MAGDRGRLVCDASAVSFGMMKNEQQLVVHKHVEGHKPSAWPQIIVDLRRSEIDVHTHIKTKKGQWEYRFRQRFAQVQSICAADSGCDKFVVIQMQLPPQVGRRSKGSWPWYRQTIIHGPDVNLAKPTGLLSDGAIIEPGRWLTLCVVIRGVGQQEQWKVLDAALNMIPRHTATLNITQIPPKGQWEWLRNPANAQDHTGLPSSLAMLCHEEVTLPYQVMYQLEVCISHGYLHESNLDHAFAVKLQTLDRDTGIPGMAQYLLEHIADLKRHFADPMDIFQHQHEVKGYKNSTPSYCASLQSVTVTPTTIYVHTPTAEISNRVLRKYSQYDRHFLRVKFRDEKYLGRVRAYDDNADEAIFQRFDRILKHGITIGGRTFCFLAYGNSQLRENGAYFFAPSHDLCAEDLRRQMGVLSDIKVVAKYASRLGQNFSTTRTSWNHVDIVDIPDIQRNGYCFSDGVGKMSSFIARMIAEHVNLPSSAQDCPSAFQFRLGGYKGILVIDPGLNGRTLELRPSQNKFPADHRGLEICRAAQYSATFLNQQIILLMSCLGVSDAVIVKRQHDMVVDLKTAMHDERMAIRLLLKCVDQNQTTITLASMIEDGFMKVQEPFLMSCLRLWLSWCVKSLKEKAKILIPDGAFLLGCVDETGKLQGHFDRKQDKTLEQKRKLLPQIFVQTSTAEPNNTSNGVTKIITGLCLVARNPSLHPGDVRVVEAIDVPDLHHLRNVVVFPQTGDRDIPGMCSGGDLDGDDFIVIWDPDMIPTEWNHEPMDYSPPTPDLCTDQITANHITTFFVEHMKYDNLGRIATAHRYWADLTRQGPYDPKCLELAALHSKAVDYAKTGVPAKMGQHLRVDRWPRWAGKTNVPRNKIYDSNKILHQLFRNVDSIDFVPNREVQFDERILKAYEVTDDLLQSAKVLKRQYDAALLRLMTQYEIKSEYELWTAFVLSHNDELKDYTLAEGLGKSLAAIKLQYRQLVFEAAGTKEQEQDSTKLGPYLVAVYTVTAQQAAAEQEQLTYDDEGPQTTAFVSFPWIFQRQLGLIARNKFTSTVAFEQQAEVLPSDEVVQQAGALSPTSKVEQQAKALHSAPEDVQQSEALSSPSKLLEYSMPLAPALVESQSATASTEKMVESPHQQPKKPSLTVLAEPIEVLSTAPMPTTPTSPSTSTLDTMNKQSESQLKHQTSVSAEEIPFDEEESDGEVVQPPKCLFNQLATLLG